MQVLAHGGRVGHRRERLRSHVLRVRAGVPHAADAVDGADVAQQLGEQRAEPGVVLAALAGRELQVAPVRVDVLAEQRDLGDALLGEHPHLGQHVGRTDG